MLIAVWVCAMRKKYKTNLSEIQYTHLHITHFRRNFVLRNHRFFTINLLPNLATHIYTFINKSFVNLIYFMRSSRLHLFVAVEPSTTFFVLDIVSPPYDLRSIRPISILCNVCMFGRVYVRHIQSSHMCKSIKPT